MNGLDALGLGRLLPGPGWLVIDAAREQRFTGEVVLLADEAVRVYFDRGRVYLAERSSDAPLGARLIESGAISEQQLEYGRLQVHDTEHLGRLFDRVPNASRDSVLTVTDLMNERTLAWLANQWVQSVGVAPYRHHSSGLHHWLDAPAAPLTNPWPAPTLSLPDPPAGDPIDRSPTTTPSASGPSPVAPTEPPQSAATPASTPSPQGPSGAAPTDGVVGGAPNAIVTWNVPDPFGDADPPAAPSGGSALPVDTDDELTTEFFGVIWPTGEVDDLADVPRSDTAAIDRDPPADAGPTPSTDGWHTPPATEPEPITAADPAQGDDALAVRRAVATIDTGSIAARRRLVESSGVQPAAPPVIDDAHPALDRHEDVETADPHDPDGVDVVDERDAEHRERAKALRRMIAGLRRE